MVDALRRAHRMLRPDGCVIDIHPTAAPAVVEIDGRDAGPLDAGNAPARHAAADAALDRTLGERLFVVAHSEEFAFYTDGDTLDELREYIAENWRDSRIPRGIRSGRRPRVRERVRITKLCVAPVVG